MKYKYFNILLYTSIVSITPLATIATFSCSTKNNSLNISFNTIDDYFNWVNYYERNGNNNITPIDDSFEDYSAVGENEWEFLYEKLNPLSVFCITFPLINTFQQGLQSININKNKNVWNIKYKMFGDVLPKEVFEFTGIKSISQQISETIKNIQIFYQTSEGEKQHLEASWDFPIHFRHFFPNYTFCDN